LHDGARSLLFNLLEVSVPASKIFQLFELLNFLIVKHQELLLFEKNCLGELFIKDVKFVSCCCIVALLSLLLSES